MIGPDEFRLTLGRFPTGVTIVATMDDRGRPRGMTASAFSSLSLSPPLVLVCIDERSQVCSALRNGGRFAVNILRADQEALARRFATRREDRFDGVGYRHGDKVDVPLLDGALANIECTTTQKHAEGDHVIFVGQVERVHLGNGAPLVYFGGRYDRLQSEVL